MNINNKKDENVNVLKKCLDIDKVRSEFIDLTEELICPICNNLVYDPICCKKCNIPFGRGCLHKWFQINKSGECPTSKCGKLEPEVMPKIFIKLINKIKLKCLNDECSEIISHDNYYKHVGNCPLGQFKCHARGCKFKGNREEIIIHLEVCSKLFEICKYCKGKFKKENFAAHEANKDECFNKIMMENLKLINELEDYKNGNFSNPSNRSTTSETKQFDKISTARDIYVTKLKEKLTPPEFGNSHIIPINNDNDLFCNIDNKIIDISDYNINSINSKNFNEITPNIKNSQEKVVTKLLSTQSSKVKE